MDKSTNILNWFEIATSDLGRAQKFYETVFQVELNSMDLDNIQMRMFPYEAGGGKLSGALVKSAMHEPSKKGAVIYFNGNPDLADALSRVEKAGGKIRVPKTQISPEFGYMAFFEDTEGNVVAMHSQG